MKYLIFGIVAAGFAIFACAFAPTLRARAIALAAILGMLFFAGAGAVLLYIGLRAAWQGIASRHWPAVPGIVLKSTMTEEQAKDIRGGRAYNFYVAHLSFGYKVNGRDLTTQNVQFGRAVGSGDEAEATVLLMRYPPGGTVRVFHDPADPALATVKPGVHDEVLYYLVVGGILFFVGVAVGLLYFVTETELRVGPYLASLLFSGLLLLGTAMSVSGMRNQLNGRASQTWPTAKGEVIFVDQDAAARVLLNPQGGIDARDGVVRRYQGESGVTPAYRYDVDGTMHYSAARHFGQFAQSGSSWSGDLLQRYPSGSEFPVSYCPSDPDVSVLEPGVDPEAFFLPVFGGVFLLAGLVGLILSIFRW